MPRALLGFAVYLLAAYGCHPQKSGQHSSGSSSKEGPISQEQTSAQARASEQPTPSAENTGGSGKETAKDATQSLSTRVPPRALSCLARAYGGQPRERDGQWFLVLAEGDTFRFSDGRDKSVEERLETPDLNDTMRLPYWAGAIVPVTIDDWDPGRARHLPLFEAVYGAKQSQVQSRLKQVTIAGQQLMVHERIVRPLSAVAQTLQTLKNTRADLAPWFESWAGGFAWRPISGTDRMSAHSYGIAVDINPKKSEYWRDLGKNALWRNQVPDEIVSAFEEHGFIWGGRWRHFDTMHFEYRPELLDPECRASMPPHAWLTDPDKSRAILQEVFTTPNGFQRLELASDSFGAFLRSLPLLAPQSPVLAYDGSEIVAGHDARLAAVVDMDVGSRDLQQCADTVIRAHAEWAFESGTRAISYKAGDGTVFDFERYLRGERVVVRDGKLERRISAQAVPRSHTALRNFVDDVFEWVNTGALAHSANRIKIEEIAPGDFFVMGGRPFGHAVLVLDVAKDAEGRVQLLLGQGYMPAQSFHVLRATNQGAWFELNLDDGFIKTPFWKPFPFDSLRRFPRATP